MSSDPSSELRQRATPLFFTSVDRQTPAPSRAKKLKAAELTARLWRNGLCLTDSTSCLLWFPVTVWKSEMWWRGDARFPSFTTKYNVRLARCASSVSSVLLPSASLCHHLWQTSTHLALPVWWWCTVKQNVTLWCRKLDLINQSTLNPI